MIRASPATLWNTEMALMIRTIRSHSSWYSQGELLLCRRSYFSPVFPSEEKQEAEHWGPPCSVYSGLYRSASSERVFPLLRIVEIPSGDCLLVDLRSEWRHKRWGHCTDLIQSLMSPDFPPSVRKLVTRARRFHYNGCTKLVVVSPILVIHTYTHPHFERDLSPSPPPPSRDWYT